MNSFSREFSFSLSLCVSENLYHFSKLGATTSSSFLACCPFILSIHSLASSLNCFHPSMELSQTRGTQLSSVLFCSIQFSSSSSSHGTLIGQVGRFSLSLKRSQHFLLFASISLKIDYSRDKITLVWTQTYKRGNHLSSESICK